MSAVALPVSLLANPEELPLLPSAIARDLGLTIVVAPHPDDESLGGGGLLALLAERGTRVPQVLVMTDGSKSHPNSVSYPAARLSELRQEETRAALAALGLPAAAVHFLGYRDCGLPPEGTVAFIEATKRLGLLLENSAPDTLLVPWRRDPHCDHEATWKLCREAIRGLAKPPRWLEYPVWAWTQAEGEVAPQAHEGHAWRLDISPVLARKEQAIACHRSQIGAVIHDDPEGFRLEPQMLANFARPWEVFIEPNDV